MNVFFIFMMILLFPSLAWMIVSRMGREVLLFPLCRLNDESLTQKSEGVPEKGFFYLSRSAPAVAKAMARQAEVPESI